MHEESKIVKDVSELNFKGRRKQVELNAKLSRILLIQIEGNIERLSEIKRLIEDGQFHVKKRQKLIRLPEGNKDSWKVAQEYMSDALSSDCANEKRIRKAKSAVERKSKEAKPQIKNAIKRFKPAGDMLLSLSIYQL